MTKPRPPRTPPASTVPEPPAPPPVCKLTEPVRGGGFVRLFHDKMGDRWQIAFEPARSPGKDVAAHLTANDFTPAEAGSWVRPVDTEARLQDLIDAERVLLKVAELAQPADEKPARKTGRGR